MCLYQISHNRKALFRFCSRIHLSHYLKSVCRNRIYKSVRTVCRRCRCWEIQDCNLSSFGMVLHKLFSCNLTARITIAYNKTIYLGKVTYRRVKINDRNTRIIQCLYSRSTGSRIGWIIKYGVASLCNKIFHNAQLICAVRLTFHVNDLVSVCFHDFRCAVVACVKERTRAHFRKTKFIMLPVLRLDYIARS